MLANVVGVKVFNLNVVNRSLEQVLRFDAVRACYVIKHQCFATPDIRSSHNVKVKTRPFKIISSTGNGRPSHTRNFGSK